MVDEVMVIGNGVTNVVSPLMRYFECGSDDYGNGGSNVD